MEKVFNNIAVSLKKNLIYDQKIKCQGINAKIVK